MGKFSTFMKNNVKDVGTVKLKLGRFEEPIEIRALKAGEADKINERCFVNKPGVKGRQERVFDAVAYNRGVSAASIVFPDLNDSELQESYGVRGAENLYSELFLLGEAAQILEKVTEISGIGGDINEDIEAAKN